MTDRLIQIKNALQNSPHYLVLISVTIKFVTMTFWLLLPVHSGSSKRIYYRNRSVWPTLFPLNLSAALNGTHSYILYFCEEMIAQIGKRRK